MNNNLDLASAVLDFPALCKAEIPERKMILPWLPEGGQVMVYAPRGIGKTFWAISNAVSVASGEPFLKWKVTSPCGVLFLDGEMDLHAFRERVSKFVKRPLQYPLATLSHILFYQRFEKDLSITSMDIQESLLTYLDSHPEIRLVIVDNLSALAHVPEDKGDYWRAQVLPFLIALRRRGVAVVLIHHAGKNGDQRGTCAREDALDTVVKLTRADDEKSDGARFKVEFTKARGVFGDDVEPFVASLKTVDGFFEWEVSNIEQSTENSLLELVEATDGLTVMESSRELKVAHSLISKIRKKLIAEGRIRMVGKNMVVA